MTLLRGASLKRYGTNSARQVSRTFLPRPRVQPRGLKAAAAIIALVCVVLAAVVWAAAMTSLRSVEENAARGGDRKAQIVAESFASYLAERVATADLLTRTASFEFKHHGGSIDLERLVQDGLIVPSDEALITIVGPDGLVHQSWPAKRRESTYLSDREHFIAQRNNPNLGLYIGAPVTGRVSGDLTIQFTRRLSATEFNEFDGVVVVSEPLRFLTASFANAANLGKEGRLFVYRSDGTFLVGARSDGMTSGTGPALSTFPVSGQAVSQLDPYAETTQRYMRRAVASYPLIVVVSLSQRDIDANYRHQFFLYWLWPSVVTFGLVFAAVSAYVAARALLTSMAEREQDATVDQLTGLGNRRRLRELVMARDSQDDRPPAALISIDIHDFGSVNKKFGTDAGDGALSQIAGRIKAMADAESALAVRVQSDQFAVVLTGSNSTERALVLTKAIFDVFRLPVNFSNYSETLRLSAGISTSTTEGDSAGNLLTQADYALDLAKQITEQSGESAYRIVDATMAASLARARLLEFELEDAIRGDEPRILPAFSPVIDCQTRHVVGVMVDPVWSRGGGEQLGLNEFRSLAEKLRLIDFVWKQAIERAIPKVAGLKSLELILCVRAPATLISSVDPRYYVFPNILPPKRMRFALTGLQGTQADDPLVTKLSDLRRQGAEVYMVVDPHEGIVPAVFNYLSIDGILIDESQYSLAEGMSTVERTFLRGVLSAIWDAGMKVMVGGIDQASQIDYWASFGVVGVCGPHITMTYPVEPSLA